MYRPTSIEAKNLFSFSDIKYNFNEGVTTLINGENRDNDSQKSNGSGKSSLIELGAIALTGSPLRKVKNDEIINDNETEASLTITLQNDVLEEVFVIQRKFSRKASQIVSFQIFLQGKEVVDKAYTSLSSVEEYNKAILDRIGLTKDEIFNTFILSKHRHKGFLLKSDTEKKAVINQFSRGNVINQAIDKVKADSEPILEEIKDIKTKKDKSFGRLDATKIQLEDEKVALVKKEEDNKDKIKELKETLTNHRKKIREEKELIASTQDEISKLNEAYQNIDNLFITIESLSQDEQIDALVSKIDDCPFIGYEQNFKKEKAGISDKVDTHKDKINESNKEIADIEAKQLEVSQKIDKLKLESLNDEDFKKQKQGFKDKVNELSDSIKKTKDKLIKIKEDKVAWESTREILLVKMAGVITCPACNHEFIVADPDFDVKTGDIELKKISTSITEAVDDIESNKKEKSLLATKKDTEVNKAGLLESDYNNQKRAIDVLVLEQDRLNDRTDRLQTIISDNKSDMSRIDEQIDAFIDNCFSEVLDFIDDKANKKEKDILYIKSAILNIEGAIDNASERITNIEKNKEDSIQDIEEKIEKYKKEYKNIEKQLLKKEAEANVFIEQEGIFIDFKTYLANSKIGDLQDTTNDFLESIGSDLRLAISGFTKVKNVTKEKISVKLLRDGVDAGSFGKFSGGEQARVNLATIMALSKLINMNCDAGKGLDFLVLDEILEACDESGLASMLSALNASKITCMVVSHGLIAENYEYRQTVIKENGESTIQTKE